MYHVYRSRYRKGTEFLEDEGRIVNGARTFPSPDRETPDNRDWNKLIKEDKVMIYAEACLNSPDEPSTE
jgi:hypothetical protein